MRLSSDHCPLNTAAQRGVSSLLLALGILAVLTAGVVVGATLTGRLDSLKGRIRATDTSLRVCPASADLPSGTIEKLEVLPPRTGENHYTIRLEFDGPRDIPLSSGYVIKGYRYAFSRKAPDGSSEEVVGSWLNTIDDINQTTVETRVTKDDLHLAVGVNLISAYLRVIYSNINELDKLCRTDPAVTFTTPSIFISPPYDIHARERSMGESGEIPSCGEVDIRWKYQGTDPEYWNLSLYSGATEIRRLRVGAFEVQHEGNSYSYRTPTCSFLAPDSYDDSDDRATVHVVAGIGETESAPGISDTTSVTALKFRRPQNCSLDEKEPGKCFKPCMQQCSTFNNSDDCRAIGGVCTGLGNCTEDFPVSTQLLCGQAGDRDLGACCKPPQSTSSEPGRSGSTAAITLSGRVTVRTPQQTAPETVEVQIYPVSGAAAPPLDTVEARQIETGSNESTYEFTASDLPRVDGQVYGIVAEAVRNNVRYRGDCSPENDVSYCIVQPGSQPTLTVSLPGGSSTIHGNVVLERRTEDATVREVTVDAYRLEDRAISYCCSYTLPVEGGRYELPNLEPGEYLLRAQALVEYADGSTQIIRNNPITDCVRGLTSGGSCKILVAAREEIQNFIILVRLVDRVLRSPFPPFASATPAPVLEGSFDVYTDRIAKMYKYELRFSPNSSYNITSIDRVEAGTDGFPRERFQWELKDVPLFPGLKELHVKNSTDPGRAYSGSHKLFTIYFHYQPNGRVFFPPLRINSEVSSVDIVQRYLPILGGFAEHCFVNQAVRLEGGRLLLTTPPIERPYCSGSDI